MVEDFRRVVRLVVVTDVALPEDVPLVVMLSDDELVEKSLSGVRGSQGSLAGRAETDRVDTYKAVSCVIVPGVVIVPLSDDATKLTV